jgi:hypothetical protein
VKQVGEKRRGTPGDGRGDNKRDAGAMLVMSFRHQARGLRNAIAATCHRLRLFGKNARLTQSRDHRLDDGCNLAAQDGDRHRDQFLFEPEADHSVHR